MDGSFRFYLPTEVIYGANVVKKAGAALALGKKALIVTGESSAKLSGALDDVLSTLTTDYVIFSEVESNPSVETVIRGGKLARQEGCDYIVAIGGGSPLDAAKVMGILAANDANPLDLYAQGWQNRALPIATIPTTAGTGSEVTQYAVLTIQEEQTKKGLGGPDLFPRVAYLDPKYTASLPLDVTVDTAVDALSHLIEGYLSKRATAASDLTALQGIATWSTALEQLQKGVLDGEARSALLLASCLGGITIAQTATAIVHGLGYPLTYFHGLPHGRANGMLIGAYLRFTEKAAPDKVANVLDLLGLTSVEQFSALMEHFFARYRHELQLSQEQVESYAAKAALTNNAANSLGDPSLREVTEILRASTID